MRGNLKKRYGDSWTFRVDIGRDPLTGKRRQRTFSFKGTRKEADKKAAEILHQLDEHSLASSDNITLGDYLTRWIQDYRAFIRPRTWDRYRGIIKNHLVPALGTIKLAKLTTEQINRYYVLKLESGQKVNTVRMHHAVLHKALELAPKLYRNPAHKAALPPEERPDMVVWNSRDVKRFLKACQGSQWYALFYCALWSGIRRSELLALRWYNIDFDNRTINVIRGLHQASDGYHITDNKSKKGRRSIPVSHNCIDVLRKHREDMIARALLEGSAVNDDALVFSRKGGRPMAPNHVSRAWRDMEKKAGVIHISLKNGRHTHASLLLKAGIHLKVVQERLGHSSIEMTADIYSHVTPGIQENAADAFDDVVKD